MNIWKKTSILIAVLTLTATVLPLCVAAMQQAHGGSAAPEERGTKVPGPSGASAERVRTDGPHERCEVPP